MHCAEILDIIFPVLRTSEAPKSKAGTLNAM